MENDSKLEIIALVIFKILEAIFALLLALIISLIIGVILAFLGIKNEIIDALLFFSLLFIIYNFCAKWLNKLQLKTRIFVVVPSVIFFMLVFLALVLMKVLRH
jgi:hypothetical protein